MSRRGNDDWAVAVTVAALTCLTAAVLATLRVVLVWAIDVYRRHWPHPVLQWTLAGAAAAWGLALLLAGALPDLAAALAVAGGVAYAGGLALVDAFDDPPGRRRGEATVVEVLAPWWDEPAGPLPGPAPPVRLPANREAEVGGGVPAAGRRRA